MHHIPGIGNCRTLVTQGKDKGSKMAGAMENIIAMFFFIALDPVYAVTYSSGNKHAMFAANIDDRKN